MSTIVRGRSAELGVLVDAVAAAERGRTALVLVDGPPGSGKSALLDALASAAAARGFTGAGRRGRGEGLRPAPRIAGPARLPVPRRLVRRRRPEPAAAPSVSLIDDVRWDEVRRAVEGRRLTRADDAHAWVLAGRTAAEMQSLAHVLSGGLDIECRTVSLAPLGPEAVARVIEDLVGAPPGPDLAEIAAGAGGNPFLLTELVRKLVAAGQSYVAAGRVRLLSAALPPGLATAVRDWVSRTVPQSRDLLRAAALLGPGFSLDELARLVGTAPVGLLGALEGALLADLLTGAEGEARGAEVGAGEGDRLAFRHELVWQALAQSVPAAARRVAHREAGDALTGRSGRTDVGDRGGGVRGVGRVGRSLPQEAELLAAVLRRPLPALTDAEVRSRLSDVLARSGRARESLAEADRVLATGDVPEPVRRTARLARLVALSLEGGTSQAAPYAEALLARAGPGDALSVVPAALSVLAGQFSEQAGADGASMPAPVPDTDGDGHEAAWRTLAQATALCRIGDYAQAAAASRLGLEQAERAGARPVIPAARLLLAFTALRTGNVPLAAHHLGHVPGDGPPSALRAWTALLVAEAESGTARAVAALRREFELLVDDGPWVLEDPTLNPWLVRAALSAGDRQRAERAAESIGRVATACPQHTALAASALQARRLLEQDIDCLPERDMSRPPEQDTNGLPEQDTEPLWPGLNESQRAIAALAARGLTNRQIADRLCVSPHTVDYHLRNVFRVLDIRSRVELARLHAAANPPLRT